MAGDRDNDVAEGSKGEGSTKRRRMTSAEEGSSKE